MFKIALCDDDLEFLKSTEEIIGQWFRERQISVEIFSYENGDALIAGNMTHHMDLIFLDIIMPLFNGIDTAKELRQQDTAVQIVFLTSSPEFALESYEVKAQNYLLKPVHKEKIWDVLAECTASKDVDHRQHLLLKTSFGYQKLHLHEIECAEAQNKKVIFYLSNGTLVEAAEPFHVIEEKLTNNDGFFKCHRSYLVYLPNVDQFNHTEIITRSGKHLPIARGYAKSFKEAYFSLMFRE